MASCQSYSFVGQGELRGPPFHLGPEDGVSHTLHREAESVFEMLDAGGARKKPRGLGSDEFIEFECKQAFASRIRAVVLRSASIMSCWFAPRRLWHILFFSALSTQSSARRA